MKTFKEHIVDIIRNLSKCEEKLSETDFICTMVDRIDEYEIYDDKDAYEIIKFLDPMLTSTILIIKDLDIFDNIKNINDIATITFKTYAKQEIETNTEYWYKLFKYFVRNLWKPL